MTTDSFSQSDRRALSSVAVQFFVNGAAFASFVPRLPEIRNELGLDLDELGIVLSIGLAIGLAAGAGAPRAIAAFGTRKALILFVLVLLAGLCIVAVSTSPIVFLLGLSVMMTADGIVDIAMNLQGSWLSARRHAPVMNRLHGLWSLGTVFGGLVAARAAASGVGLRTHLLIVAAALGGALIFVGRGLLRVDEGIDDETAVSGGARPKRSRQRRVMLITLAAAGSFALVSELVSSDWAAFRLTEDFEVSAGFAGLGFVAFTVGMTAGRLVGDSVLMRLGSDRLFRAAIVASGCGLAIASLIPNRFAVLVGYVIAGVGISTFFPKLYDDAAKFPGRRGAALTWLRAGAGVAAMLIPVTVGLLADSRLSVGAATAIVTLPSVVALFALSEWSSRRPAVV